MKHLKKIVYYSFTFLLVFTFSSLFSQTPTPFKKGEKLEYRLHYGLVDAGTAKLTVSSKNESVRGESVYHIIGEGRSNRFFDFFFKVRDKYESYFNEDLEPLKFVRNVNEGGYKIEQEYNFYPNDSIVDNGKNKKYKLPSDKVQDMVSSFYYARSLDYSNIKDGDIIDVPTFMDDEIYHLKLKYKGKETIKVEGTKYRCMKFVPVMQTGRIFKEEEDLLMWITDDKNKIPVAAQAKVLVGSIRMDLTHYEGLAHPIAKL